MTARDARASLHISLGGARHKAVHDVMSNLHTLRVRSRVDVLSYRYTPLSCIREIRRFWKIGVRVFLASCLVYRPDRIRSDRYVHVWGNAVAAGSRGNEKSIFTGRKRKFQLDRTDFNAAEFIPVQLIFA